VVLQCSCGHRTKLGLADLRAFPQSATLRDLAQRATCSICTGGEVDLYTVNANANPGGGWTA